MVCAPTVRNELRAPVVSDRLEALGLHARRGKESVSKGRAFPARGQEYHHKLVCSFNSTSCRSDDSSIGRSLAHAVPSRSWSGRGCEQEPLSVSVACTALHSRALRVRLSGSPYRGYGHVRRWLRPNGCAKFQSACCGQITDRAKSRGCCGGRGNAGPRSPPRSLGSCGMALWHESYEIVRLHASCNFLLCVRGLLRQCRLVRPRWRDDCSADGSALGPGIDKPIRPTWEAVAATCAGQVASACMSSFAVPLASTASM